MVSGSWERFHLPLLKAMVLEVETMCPFKVEENDRGQCPLGPGRPARRRC